MKILLIVFLVFNTKIFAHGDHSAPGAIPPAPNGGVLSEAKHKHKHTHDHDENSEREIFFEAKLKNKTIHVFPLELDQKTGQSFKELKTSDFKELKFNIVDPRKKIKINYKLNTVGEKWSLELSKVRSRRLIVEISAVFNAERYKAKVQVEK